MLSDRCGLVREGESVVAGFRETAGVIEVSLRGDVDLASRTSMVEEVARLFGRGGAVIRIDLAAVTFLDAAGIGACLELQRKARASNRELVFTNANGVAARVIDVLGLESVLLGGDRRGSR